MTWEKGRQLKSFDGISYTYNANGIRTSKTVDGKLHTYTLDGTKILRETWDRNVLIPMYDNEDSVCGIIYNNRPFYFIKNLQGDVIAITDDGASIVACYSYDAWGVPTIVQDTTYEAVYSNGTEYSFSIATINPYLYRSYYFDSEIGLYYLQSRYYNPITGRFINADEATYVNSCLDLYAYCNNTPIILSDSTGYAASYNGIIGFGIQVMISLNVWYMQGFCGFEAIWFSKKNNFGNGFVPWCYCFYGGSFGMSLDFEKLLTPNIINNPKSVLKNFGLTISCSVSVTCFLVTGNKFRDPYDYTDWVDFWTGTVWGVTVSKAWGSRSTTYGVGVTWEVGVNRWSISVGKKLFGTTGGSSCYSMIAIGENAKSLYNTVKGRV